MKHFKSYLSLSVAIALTTTACASSVTQQTAAGHAAAGTRAGSNFPKLVELCDLAKPLINVAERQSIPGRTRPERPGRAQMPPLPPMQVFDNLYFVGNRQVSAWVLGTDSGGYILIDAMNSDNQSKNIVERGMLSLGLDPKKIKYLVITHAHGDHYGGQNYIATTYGPRVAMSDADWKVLEDPAQRIENPGWGPRPVRDVTLNDGETLTIPGTTVQVRVTPGHTPGTISLIFPVFDKGVRHMAALWGGTGFNFGRDEARLRQYADSASRFAKIAAGQEADVFLSNHPSNDSGIEKMAALAKRGPKAPNPFVMGKPALEAFTVVRECALAQAERVKSGAE